MGWEQYRCACAFGKAVGDSNPFHFPRVGMAHNIIRRGHWIIRHSKTGREATIIRGGAGPLHPEADTCCFEFFDTTEPEGE